MDHDKNSEVFINLEKAISSIKEIANEANSDYEKFIILELSDRINDLKEELKFLLT